MSKSDFTYSVECPSCGGEWDIEVEIISYGHPGTPPSFSYPGDPPEGPELDYTVPNRCPIPEDEQDKDEPCTYAAMDFPKEMYDALEKKLEDNIYEAAEEHIRESSYDPCEDDY